MFWLLEKSGKHSRQTRQSNDPHHPHCSINDGGDLVEVLRADAPDAFKCWLSGGVQDLGESVVKELLMNWLNPFLTVEPPQLALHNNKTLAAALHASNSGQPLQQWIQWNHPDRLTFPLRERGWRLRSA